MSKTLEESKESKARALYEVMRKQPEFQKEYPNIAARSWEQVTERVRQWFRLISKPLAEANRS